MFVIPGILLLFTFVYIRPHEFFDTLRPVTLAHMLGVVGVGYVLDLRTRLTRLLSSPILLTASLFFVWVIISILIRAPATLAHQLPLIGAAFLVFLVTSQGLQSLRAITVGATIVFALSIFLAAVGVHQGLSQPVCYDRAEEFSSSEDLRPCNTVSDCHEGGDPGIEYSCEHPGIMETRSIGGRVRFRGLLQDPNELAWAVGVALPIAFAWYERRRNALRLMLVLGALVLCVTCVVMTKSRSGQLSLPAVVGVYFLRRFGWKGAALAVVLSIPVMMLGGRSGAEADSSSEERLECWAEALAMWRENPILGVGGGQFGEHHYLTAHNSFMLVLAELGPVGLLLWTLTIYVAFKIAISVTRDFAARPDAAAARTWALAFLGLLSGFVVSAFFLSLPYHAVLWIELGLCGALYATVRRHDPTWKISITRRDVAIVAGIDTLLVSAIMFYTRLKGL